MMRPRYAAQANQPAVFRLHCVDNIVTAFDIIVCPGDAIKPSATMHCGAKRCQLSKLKSVHGGSFTRQGSK